MSLIDIQEHDLREAYTREYVESQKQKYYQMLHGNGLSDRRWHRQWHRRVEEIYQLVGQVTGQTVLDLGCGVGTFALEYARRGNQTFGLDFTLEMTQTGEELALEQGLLGARFVTGQVSLLPFSDDMFDVIIASDIAEHLLPQTLVASLEECLRVLKPGGRLVVHTDPSRYSYLFNHVSTGLLLAMLAWVVPPDTLKRIVSYLNVRVIPPIRRLLGRARPLDLIHVNLLTVWELRDMADSLGSQDVEFQIERACSSDIYPEDRPWFFRYLYKLLPASTRPLADRNIYLVALKQAKTK